MWVFPLSAMHQVEDPAWCSFSSATGHSPALCLTEETFHMHSLVYFFHFLISLLLQDVHLFLLVCRSNAIGFFPTSLEFCK